MLPLDVRVSHLPRPALAKLLRRLRSRGLRVLRVPPDRPIEEGRDFHLDGCCVRFGAVWWTPAGWMPRGPEGACPVRGTPLDTLLHEAAHALLMPRDLLATFRGGDVEHALPHVPGGGDEREVMRLQVELARGIPGLGVRWAVGSMDRIGYTFPGDVAAWTWWRAARLTPHVAA